MENDDDFDAFSSQIQPHHRLKRLKKTIKSHINSPTKSARNESESINNPILTPLGNDDEIKDLLDDSPIKSARNEPESINHPILTKIVNDDEVQDLLDNSTIKLTGKSRRLIKDPILTELVNDDEMVNSIKSTEGSPGSIKDPILTPLVNDDEIGDLIIKSTGKSQRLSEDPILNKMDFESLDSDDSQDFELPSFEALEVGKSVLDSEESNGFSSLRKEGGNVDGVDKGVGYDGDNDLFGKKREGAKRLLEFGDMVGEKEGKGVGDGKEIEEENVGLKMDKKRANVDDLDEDGDEDTKKKKKMKKKKRAEGNVLDDGKVIKPAVNKRKEEKERRVQREQLHAETQRVLRETRDVGFRPAPVVHKPISLVLEKIRQRKLEVSRMSMSINNSLDEPGALRDSDVCVEEIETRQSSKTVEKELDANEMEIDGTMGASKEGIESTAHTSHEEASVQKELDVEPTPTFRAPVDDTQDLVDDSQVSSGKDELLGDLSDSPLEEPFAPSLLAMKLKFDSALPDDSSSDDEYNEKENISPDLQEDGDDSSIPKGDPVKAFIDEEAEEEDSDNDINGLRDDDEDEDMDAEELNDIIATNYEERPADKERRNELHQKWLEQQDAAGTDHYLQKFKFSSKGRETTIADEGHTDSEDEEEPENEVQDVVPRDNARMNLKKAKQMIAQMFIDKDDVFLSDEEEETGKILEKQRLLRSEERARLISPAEDENSREVFGLIKKLNIVPEHKRKPKPASILDTMLGESSDSSFKSSFIGHSSDRHLPSSKGQRSSATRSFVFGRDDSNSRSSLLTSEDSSDAVPKDIKSSKNTTPKFTSSQVRSSQVYSSAGRNSAETSLLDILKKSSTLPSVKPTGVSMSGLSGSVLDAYKIPRRPVRAEARGL